MTVGDRLNRPLGSTCMVCTRAGIRCQRRPVMRTHGIDACTQHAQMIKDGMIVSRKLDLDIASDPGATGDHCGVCHGEIRQYVNGDGLTHVRYVHLQGAFWVGTPHKVVPVWWRKRNGHG